MYKFGTQVPESITHAYKLYKLNGNTLWEDPIQKEMNDVAKGQIAKGREKSSVQLLIS